MKVDAPPLPTIRGVDHGPAAMKDVQTDEGAVPTNGDSNAKLPWTPIPTETQHRDFSVGITVTTDHCDPPNVCPSPLPVTITITVFVGITI